MRLLAAPTAILMLVLLLAGPALAADTIILSDGSTRRGEILEVQEDGLRVRFRPKSGGKAELTVPAARLDAHFFYGLRDGAIADDDAKGHLKLALWAIDAGLFSRAKIQVQKATEIDPQLVKDIQEGKLPDIREGIAKRVLASAQKDMEEGRLENAEKKLEALLSRMPDTEAGTQAIEVYKALGVQVKESAAKQEQEKLDQMAEEERKREEALRKRVGPIKKDLEKGKEYLQNGLTEDSESKSLQLLHKAIGKGEDGLKGLEKLEAEVGDDADLKKKIDDTRARVIAGMVKAHIHRANVYTWRGSTRNAQKELDAARALDPDNPDITAAEERADDRNNQDALELSWTRNRREGMRFRGGGAFHGARGGGGGARGGGGGGGRR